ncbi:acetylglutamate kinase [Neobacillus sp. PS3-34]|uniref:acetylglutamate kinase n=1 Tax=Neobacillus sp. PS3-34 TaxID=3070678 RepID=UPI0027E030DA|nr:acetylglutamate kinase [Neobacillus sp. PS3-34]WML49844.1 acetylglutamate kinase [Neobacillus sp. PS3-34]
MNCLVIKCGGSIFEKLPKTFYEDIVSLSQAGAWTPIIVHGGGPLITNLLNSFNIETSFVNGLRVTSNAVLDVVEMVLSGVVNKQVVRHLMAAGGNAVGISGIDGGLLMAQPVDESEQLGFVGDVVEVNSRMIENLFIEGYIPVISPIGIDSNGQRYNINGDIAASAIAKALGANLCFISDIPGIMAEQNGVKVKLDRACRTEVLEMIDNGAIWGGMIPKVKAALNGLFHNVREAAIINGLEPHSLIDYCNGLDIGTKIVLEKEIGNG